MKSQYLKTLFLVALSVAAISIAAPYGPLAHMPNTITVDESYLSIVRNHEIYLGFVAFLVLFLANYWVDVKSYFVILAAFLGGSFYFIYTQASDPDFLSFLLEALALFHVHYLLSGVVVLLIFLCFSVLRKKIS